MNINGMGLSSGMPVMNAATPKVRPQADNAMAQKMQPMASAPEKPGRAMTEAKGMFVDTYA